MKKVIIFIISIVVGICTIDAKTIYWLTFIDTNDPRVGVVDINTRELINSRWINLVDAALSEEGYNSVHRDIYGLNLSPERCKEEIQNLKCTSEDIVVFYYVGHGARSLYDKTKFPQMAMGQTNESKLVPTVWVYNELKKKNARLTITMSMCCNVYDRVATPKDNILFAANYGNTYMSEDVKTKIKDLFLSYKGDIIACSSSMGESSWAEGRGRSDYYSIAVLTYFNNVIPSINNPTWEHFFDYLRTSVSSMANEERGVSQVPQAVLNVTKVAPPSTTQPQLPQKDVDHVQQELAEQKRQSEVAQQQSENEGQEQDRNMQLATFLEQSFDYVINTSVDATSRMHMADKLKQLFTKDAVVKIMSQDGNVVVDKESASNYLDRISTSRLLCKVALVDGGVNDKGQIVIIRVKEVYKY